MRLGYFLAGWLAAASLAMAAGCAPVEQEQIEAGDLAVFLPAFRQVPPETPIAPSPAPGVRRILRTSELLSAARRLSLELDTAPDLCFEWPMQPLDRAGVREAMKTALGIPEARIEIVEISARPAPRGKIVFRREDLVPPALPGSHAAALWRGNVVYGADRRFAIWARVLLSARLPRIVAAVPIKQGETVAAAQLRVDQVEAFPGPGDTARALDQVIGRVALRSIPADSEIRLNQLELPRDISRGDTVQVEVRSGPAHLVFTARALSGGRAGEVISLRNPRSNKLFQARILAKGKALVDAAVPEVN